MKVWVCECGQECVANENPTEGFPKWDDGHICKFRLSEQNRNYCGTSFCQACNQIVDVEECSGVLECCHCGKEVETDEKEN